MVAVIVPLCAGLALGGCAASGSQTRSASANSNDEIAAMLGKMMAGESQMKGAALEKKVEEASAYPLGSADNPVRAHLPPGQRAYLSRLRCVDLSRPAFYRAGSAGLSPYGNIVDLYVVTCEGGEPAESEVYIDMYHPGHVEEAAVKGFGIVGGRIEE